MKQFVPDDSSVTPVDPNSPGQKKLAEVQAKAKAIYPDHGESQTKYVFEKLAEEIDRLTTELKNRPQRTVYTGQAPIDEG